MVATIVSRLAQDICLRVGQTNPYLVRLMNYEEGSYVVRYH